MTLLLLETLEVFAECLESTEDVGVPEQGLLENKDGVQDGDSKLRMDS